MAFLGHTETQEATKSKVLPSQMENLRFNKPRALLAWVFAYPLAPRATKLLPPAALQRHYRCKNLEAQEPA